LANLFGEHLGPALMLVFAVFSNTLLLTILISILTNTFSVIQYNLVEESLYQNAVTTLDMVKGDALFEFMAPTNLIALPLLIPAKLVLNPVSTFNASLFLHWLTWTLAPLPYRERLLDPIGQFPYTRIYLAFLPLGQADFTATKYTPQR